MNESDLHPGRWWERTPEGRFRCDLCPRHCVVSPGQRAFCFVRMGTEDGIALTTWGRSSGFCIDPIEKKPLNHYLPGTSILSFGTAGCNLGCRFCQNWDISKAKEWDRLNAVARPQDIASAAVLHGSRAVAFTYNDPVIFAEYALDIAAACREVGIATVAVSAGYITDKARAEFFSGMDATNIDLKGFTPEFYKKLCFAELEPVKDTLKWLVHESKTWTEITTLLIPDANDSDAELEALTQWVAAELGPEVPLHFTAFHPDFKLTDRGPTPPATLFRARDIALKNGLRFVYTGNVRDARGGSTWCPGCGALLIERLGYDLRHWGLDGNRCRACRREIPGRFEARPGAWGSRRQPIRIGPAPH